MSTRHHKVNRSTDDDFTGNVEVTSMVGKKTLKNRPKPKQSAKTKKLKKEMKREKKHHQDDPSFHVADLRHQNPEKE